MRHAHTHKQNRGKQRGLHTDRRYTLDAGREKNRNTRTDSVCCGQQVVPPVSLLKSYQKNQLSSGGGGVVSNFYFRICS